MALDKPAAAPPLFDAGSPALDLLPWPIWVLDPAALRNLYANAAGLALWRAESLEALQQREHEVSPAERTRLRLVADQVARGDVVELRWTFCCNGEAETMDLVLRAVCWEDGRQVILVQGAPCDPDPADRRAAEALRFAPIATTLYDADGRPLFRNPAAEVIYPAPDHRFADRFQDAEEAEQIWARALGGDDVSRDVRVTTAAGERWHGLDARPTIDPVTGQLCVLVNEREMTALKEIEASLVERERELTEAQEIAHLAPWRFDIGERRFVLSQTLAAPLGLGAELSCRDMAALLAPEERTGLLRLFYRRLALGSGGELTLSLPAIDSERRSFWVRWEARPDRDGTLRSLMGVARDVTEETRTRDRIAYLALHDRTTGLANRARCTELLNQFLQRGDGIPGCLMLVNLDGFKEINELRGHGAGDEVLVETARRLQAALRPNDLVARLGGDEFGLLLPGVDDPAVVERRSREVLEQLRVPMLAGGAIFSVTASIGAANWPLDGASAAELLRNADLALNRAKAQGGNAAVPFDEALRAAFDERRWITEELPAAIARGEVEVHYQPLHCLASGMPVGFEALMRWRHPTRGLIPPMRFLAAAEESGLIWQLGQHVLEQSAAQLRAWLEAGLEPGWIAVNVGAGQLRNGQFPQLVRSVLEQAGLPTWRLELEVTENVTLGRDAERAQRVIEQLAESGVRIVLDDFGTGYASLTHLKRLPIFRLKIDRSFIMNLESDSSDAAIVRTVVDLARSLRLSVVAEGVERQSQVELLRGWGCDLVQGFLYRPALEAEEAGRWLAEQGRLLAPP